MTMRTVPFDYSFFYHAMVGLLGREPDTKYCGGLGGIYTFRYEPKDNEEVKKFSAYVMALQQWLSLFEIIPFRTRCDYGRLAHPQKEEEGRDYLDIVIVHPVERKSLD